MKKYTRRDINIKAELHGKSFFTQEDVEKALMQFGEKAIEAGADEDKLMEALKGD